MQLSQVQQREIFEDGFTLLRGVVPRLLIDEALRAIHYSLGKKGIHPDDLPTLRSQTYCPELTKTTAITDLFTATPLKSLCESALGEDGFLPVQRGQIALRFPNSPPEGATAHPHLDGMASPNNGVDEGTFGNFTALLGVFLSDLPTADMGNFTVWPGTHRAYEKYFQEHGVDAFLQGTPPIELPDALPLTGRAGDAVLCHYQLGHTVGFNLSPHIRYAVFFRLESREHNDHRREVLIDIWRDWPGLAAVAGDAAQPIRQQTPQ